VDPLRILIADDESIRLLSLRVQLNALGHHVVAEASTGADAVTLAAATEPDLAIMDIKMPVMDGIEATRIIAKRWPRVKVLGLSMHDSDSPIGEGFRAAGAVAYVPKAAPPKEFLRALRSCLPGRPRR